MAGETYFRNLRKIKFKLRFKKMAAIFIKDDAKEKGRSKQRIRNNNGSSSLSK